MGTCLIIKSGGGTDTSNATATADKILSGYTIYSNDNKITGSMTNIGAQTASGLNASGSTTIKAGWHNGSGTVTTNSLASQTGGTSIAVGDVLSGYTYWTSGAKATGTMTSRGAKAWTIGVNGSQTIESGWHIGSGTVKQSSTVATSSEWKLMNPTTSNQTLCNASTYYSQNRWCAGSDKLIAANIKKDITIFGVKGTYIVTTRWIVQNGSLVNGVSMEYTYNYSPNDDGTPSSEHKTNVTPVTNTVDGNTYIKTQYVPNRNDKRHSYYYFSNVGGKIFSYTGSSTSNWKIPSFHVDWAANGLGSRDLCVYYSFGSNGGFSKIISGKIWTWYSKTCTGSVSITSVSSTKSGLPVYTGWSGTELQSGSLLIAVSVNGSADVGFYICNLWFDTNAWI